MVFGIYFGGFNIAGEINVVHVIDNQGEYTHPLWAGDFKEVEIN
jgi:hypothetical protein